MFLIFLSPFPTLQAIYDESNDNQIFTLFRKEPKMKMNRRMIMGVIAAFILSPLAMAATENNSPARGKGPQGINGKGTAGSKAPQNSQVGRSGGTRGKNGKGQLNPNNEVGNGRKGRRGGAQGINGHGGPKGKNGYGGAKGKNGYGHGKGKGEGHRNPNAVEQDNGTGEKGNGRGGNKGQNGSGNGRGGAQGGNRNAQGRKAA